MNFISIHQYFNKLQIVFLSLMMVPLLAFIAIYLVSETSESAAGFEYYLGIPSLALLDWLVAITTFNKKIKSVRKVQGLGAKLDKYFEITIVRYAFASSAALILAAGFFVTRSEIFTMLFLGNLVLAGLCWPTGPRVARELSLRGDEREMVYFKKDKF